MVLDSRLVDLGDLRRLSSSLGHHRESRKEEIRPMRRLIAIVLCLFCLRTAAANPQPESSERLMPQLELFLSQGQNADCSGLVKVLSRGSLTIDSVSLRLIEENLPALERCLIESQRSAHSPSRLELHRLFREHARRQRIQQMRAVLRRRIVIPRDLDQITSRKAMTAVERNRIHDLVAAADLLSEYRNLEDADFLLQVADSLAHSPADTCCFPRGISPPSWFVHMAARRCEIPEAGAVFLVEPDTERRFLVRGAAEIARIEVSLCDSTSGRYRPGFPFAPEEAIAVLTRLGSGVAAHPPAGFSYSHSSASIKVHFADGVRGYVSAHRRGWVLYEDNRSWLGFGWQVHDPDLAARIWALAAPRPDRDSSAQGAGGR
jgi:hypothetical protein